jgi:hypothetical protein
MPSPDFSHFFFSSANVAFAPGGQTAGDGSVYDNDLGTGSVTIASLLPGGPPIPPEPGDEEDDYFTLPAASTDGSHILIAATGTGVCGKAKCGAPPDERIACYAGLVQGHISGPQRCPENLPSHLYMRVDGNVTYDVSRGAVVHYDGMVRNGSKVYFTTDEDLTEDNSDSDSSIDLYVWSEEGDTVTRVSAGAGSIGNTDNCNALWTVGCGVEVVPSLEGMGKNLTGETPDERLPVHGGVTPVGFTASDPTDNSIAGVAGDVYFYSPEQFVPGKGIPGRRNLYVFRAGQIEFVATLASDKPTTRFQVAPDGRRAAFITASRLTTYDNAGYQAMYTYTPASGALVCVSCTPSGAPPTSNVFGSQNGLFMSDDGRTFFQTETALLPHDTNGLIDVYEYVEGRPQLISSGVASIQKSAFGVAGLIGVSADGTDVYFANFDRLVEEDHNGQLLRFYDARTGGGFAQASLAAPCAAADECHGPPNQTDSLPAIGSSANLGPGGNLLPAARRAHRQKKGHKKKKKHHRRHGRHARSNRGERR